MTFEGGIMQQRASKRRERAERKKERRRERVKEVRHRETQRNLVWWAVIASVAVLVIGGIIGGFVYAVATNKTLPPTSFSPNHSESLPPQQINTTPIPRLVQEHVMERGGGHPPGQMLVQYNCQDYQCEPDLVQKLTDLVQGYPPQVYLAPYPGMDAKIALAAPGKLDLFVKTPRQPGARWG